MTLVQAMMIALHVIIIAHHKRWDAANREDRTSKGGVMVGHNTQHATKLFLGKGEEKDGRCSRGQATV